MFGKRGSWLKSTWKFLEAVNFKLRLKFDLK